MDKQLEQAITHIKKGNKERGKEKLIRLLRDDSQNELAWLWMSKCTADPAHKMDCYERVLAINPNNKYAKQGLARLGQRSEKDHNKEEERKSSDGKKKRTFLVIAVLGMLVSLCGAIFWLGTSSGVECQDPSPGRISQVRTLLDEINPNNQIGQIQVLEQTGNENFGWDGDYVAAQIIKPNTSTNRPIIGVWFLSKPTQDGAMFFRHELNDAAKKYSNYSPRPREIDISSNRIDKVKQCVLDRLNSNAISESPKPTQPKDFLYKIPGLNYQDIVEHLRRMGILCEPEKPVTEGHLKECHGEFNNGEIIVDVSVYSAEHVNDIYILDTFVYQRNFSNASDEIAAEILGQVASIEFKGSNPKIMDEWVNKYISVEHENGREMPRVLVEDVVFGLPCNTPEDRCLVIGRMPNLWFIDKQDIPQIQELDLVE